MAPRRTMCVAVLVLLSVAVMSEASYIRPVTRVVHYHSPPARYVYTRHLHYHEPAARLVRFYGGPVYDDHYHHHHHPVEEVVDAAHPYYVWRK